MNKRWGCVGIILLVLLCISGLFNLVFIGAAISGRGAANTDGRLPQFDEELVAKGSGTQPDKITLISLRGVISSSLGGSEGDSMVDDIKIQLQQALDDAKVKAIVLNIDSPGGEVAASDVIYNAVRTARARKPVVVYMGSLAASGGYYVSCGGSYLMASDTSLTGSIGVIIETVNYSQLLSKVGVSPVVIKSGNFKDMMSGARDMTDDERKYVQGLVNETFAKFCGIVSTERHIPLDALRPDAPQPIADGRVISGKDALAKGLIDKLGSMEDAIAKAKDLGGAPDAEVVRYKPSFGLGKFFKMLGESNAASQSRIEVNLTQKMMPSLEPGKMYMLPDFYAQ